MCPLQRFFLAVVLITSFYPLFGNENCKNELAVARQQYLSGKFEDTIELTTRCLKKRSLDIDTKIKAHELKALSYLSKEFRQHAKSEVKRIFALNESYNPNLDELIKPDYLVLVDEMRKQKKQVNMTKWILLGAGSIIAAGLIIVVLSEN